MHLAAAARALLVAVALPVALVLSAVVRVVLPVAA